MSADRDIAASRHSLLDDRDDERLERLSRVYEFVPLAWYDDVTKLAQYAVSDFITERDKANAEVSRLRSAVEDAAHIIELADRSGYDAARLLREYVLGEKYV